MGTEVPELSLHDGDFKDSEPIAPSMDRWIDLATEAVLSAAIELSIDLTLHESCDAELPDSSSATDSEPLAHVPIESDWAPIMEFTSADIFSTRPSATY